MVGQTLTHPATQYTKTTHPNKGFNGKKRFRFIKFHCFLMSLSVTKLKNIIDSSYSLFVYVVKNITFPLGVQETTEKPINLTHKERFTCCFISH